MCCTEWIASGRGDHEGLFLPKEVLEKVTPLSGPWSKQQLFSYSHFLSHSLRIHFAHWSSTTKSHRSGANNQKKKKKKFATSLYRHIKAWGVWWHCISLSSLSLPSNTALPHADTSALTSGNLVEYIPDSLEFPASVLPPITPAANLEPPNMVVQCTNCVAVCVSPVYSHQTLPITGDYFKSIFCIFHYFTHLKIEHKNLHMGKIIHSTLQNSLMWRPFPLRRLLWVNLQDAICTPLCLKTLNCFWTLQVRTLCFIYSCTFICHTYQMLGLAWGASPCCFTYLLWEQMRLLLPSSHHNKGGWKLVRQRTNHGSSKFKFKSSLVWLQNP